MKQELFILIFTIASAVFFITGIRKINSYGFYKNSKLYNLLTAVGSLGMVLPDTIDLLKYDYDSGYLLLLLLIIIVVSVTMYQFYATIKTMEITLYGISFDDLYNLVEHVLDKHKIPFDLEEEDGVKKFVLQNYNAEIKPKAGYFSNKVNTIHFSKYKNTPHYQEILMTLEDKVISEKEKDYKFKGAFEILLGVGFVILAIYFADKTFLQHLI